MTNSTHSTSTNPKWPLDAHTLSRMDKLAALVVTLDGDTFNATLPIPVTNSLAMSLRHVTGSARYWPERACPGRDYARDCDGGFSVHCSVTEELEIYHRDRIAIEFVLVELQGMDRTAAPAVIPTDKDHWRCSSIEGVTVHVFHEAAQHLGHAETVRNALAIGLGDDDPDDGVGSSFPRPFDAIIGVLTQAGHASDFIEYTAGSKTHITTVDSKTVTA